MLFSCAGISRDENAGYLARINQMFTKGEWKKLARVCRKAPAILEALLEKLENDQRTKSRLIQATPSGSTDKGMPVRSPASETGAIDGDSAVARKRPRTESPRLRRLRNLRPRWEAFSRSLDQFEKQVSSGGLGKFAFAFVEGKIVKAMKEGDWVL